MHLDIQVAGEKNSKDLEKLRSDHFSEIRHGTSNSLAETIFKILSVSGGFFFALFFIMTMPPDLAFLSITLVTILTIAMFAGSGKIIQLFPTRIWFWNPGYYRRPFDTTVYIPSQTTTRQKRYSPEDWQDKGQPIYPPPSASSYDHSPMWTHTSSSKNAFPSAEQIYVGQGHESLNFVAKGTNNVPVNGGHVHRTKTPSGNVIPNSRKKE